MIHNLMLVDDNVIDHKVYRRTVKKSGLIEAFHPFTSAAEALAFLKQGDRPKIDVILCDIRMPELDGFEFLEAASDALGPAFDETAVIMMTTSASAQDLERAKAFPVIRDYVLKPLDVAHLQEIDGMLAS